MNFIDLLKKYSLFVHTLWLSLKHTLSSYLAVIETYFIFLWSNHLKEYGNEGQ